MISPMGRAFDRFVGIDLGGGKGRTTAVASLRLEEGGVSVEHVGLRDPGGERWFDARLVAYLEAAEPGTALGIDAPLTLPACVRCKLERCPGVAACVDPAVVWFRDVGEPGLLSRRGPTRGGKPAFTPYTQRPAEVWLELERDLIPRETLGQGMGPLTARARHLTLALRPRFALHENLIEVYPKATIQALFPGPEGEHYRHDHEVRQRILHALADLRFPPRSGMMRNTSADVDHCFDALIAAYTTYLWARDEWTLPAEHAALLAADGFIWAPPIR